MTLTSPGIVAYGDGERLGPLPMTATVRPGALRVFAPPCVSRDVTVSRVV